MGVPGRFLFHSTSMIPWVMPQGGARGQNLGHPNKVVYCNLFIQTTVILPYNMYFEDYFMD